MSAEWRNGDVPVESYGLGTDSVVPPLRMAHGDRVITEAMVRAALVAERPRSIYLLAPTSYAYVRDCVGNPPRPLTLADVAVALRIGATLPDNDDDEGATT